MNPFGDESPLEIRNPSSSSSDEAVETLTVTVANAECGNQDASTLAPVPTQFTPAPDMPGTMADADRLAGSVHATCDENETAAV